MLLKLRSCSSPDFSFATVLLHTDDTAELPDDVDELSEIMELGRRLDDLPSGNIPIRELRNFVAVLKKR